ncbi:MAG: hypothetical protein ACON3Z_02265 [Bradymonadia bacterium]
MSATKRTLELGLLLLAVTAASCNEHPVQPLEGVVTAVNRQTNELPAKTKLDFLFVIDTSNSMCQEQQNLSENFSAFSNFLFNELGASADYRLAVTNMDTDEGKARGRFLVDPAAPAVAQGCPTADGVGFVPNTADCQALVDSGALKPVLRGEEIQSQQQLEQIFRCMATLGTGGSGVERGLEAMRLALSCNGPNAAQFGGCCIDNPDEPNTGRKIYNPSCSPEVMGFAEPEFLRPDALLVVIFVSDENDCSSPSDNPQESTRPICKYNIVDQDGDGVPDGYNDRALCQGLGPAACYARDCGQYDPQACRDNRCSVDVNANPFYCAHYPSSLTDVVDYARFLENLKANPLEQLVVATIVGQRGYTEAGSEIYYRESVTPLAPMCVPVRSDTDVPANLAEIQSEQCCPGGRCEGNVQPSCYTPGNGIAYSGRRYLELAEAFGNNGIGCPAVLPADVAPEQVQGCAGLAKDAECQWRQGDVQYGGKCRPVEGQGSLACSECLSICEDSFQRPLQAIKSKVAEILATYCLDKTPACIVANADPALNRYCMTPEEYATPSNYSSSILVRSQCLLTEAQGGRCEVVEEPRQLSYQNQEWSLELGVDECAGGALVRLRDPPPAGAEIFVEFFVQVETTASSGRDGGEPAVENAPEGQGAGDAGPMGMSL